MRFRTFVSEVPRLFPNNYPFEHSRPNLHPGQLSIKPDGLLVYVQDGGGGHPGKMLYSHDWLTAMIG